MIASLIIFLLLYNFTLQYQYPTLRAHEFERYKGKIPESFDARKNWPNCIFISWIKNQGSCRTSWAISPVMATSDRLCIFTEQLILIDHSIQEVLTCCEDCYDFFDDSPKCNKSGDAARALYFLISKAKTTDVCHPYNWREIESECKHYPHCKTKSPTSLISTSEYSDLRDVQYEIMTRGPVVSFMRVDAKFRREGGRNQVSQEQALYRKPPKDAHVVRVVGWGVQGQVPYWLVANTWGKEWGLEGGFFKVRRGRNDFGIEDLFIAATFEKMSYHRSLRINSACAINRAEIFNILIVIFCIYIFF